MKINCNARLMAIYLSVSIIGSHAWQAASAEDAHKSDAQAALIKALPQSKLTMIDGLQQATKTGGAPISAKFEFDDAGKLSLSIYMADTGINTDAEHNVLKELSGSPEQTEWKPETEVFKDVPHVARSSEQLTLLRLSSFTLVDILTKVQKLNRGTVFSITPAIQGRRPVFVVLVATRAGKVTQLDYNLLDGSLLTAGK